MRALVDEIRLRAEAALYRRLDAGSGFADPRVPAQIYLRDEGARARLAAGTLRPRGTHAKAAAAAMAAIAEVRAGTASRPAADERGGDGTASRPAADERRGAGTASRPTADERSGAERSAGGRVERVDLFAQRIGLDGASVALAVCAAAYAIDLDVRELCHALAPRRAKPALYVETCVEVLELAAPAAIEAIAPGSALRRARAIVVDGEGLAAGIELAGSTLAWLLGDDALPAPLAQVVTALGTGDDLGVTLPGSSCGALDGIVERLRALAAERDDGVTVILRGMRGSGRRAAAHRIARALGRPLDVIAVPALLAVETRAKTAVLGQALAAARLRDAVPYLADADALYDDRGELAAEHAAALATVAGPILVGTAGRAHLSLGRATLAHALPRAELAERGRAWSVALASHPAGTEAAELAARYVIGPGAIAEVTAEAARQARAAGTC
ncbi:MAG: hypothetical protein KIT31_27765, partial [Deltaproteobacteria bacterium]|nr:hypothetical protein [Deltaproteobacteria bacterium]